MAVPSNNRHRENILTQVLKLPFSKLTLVAMLAALVIPLMSLRTEALASTITLSTLSSEPKKIPVSVLDATLDFDVSGSTLTLTLTNDTTDPNTFDINEVYFSTSDDVTDLILNSVTHSVVGDVLAGWSLFPSTGDGGPTHRGGFGVHDFALLDGLGIDPELVGPNESVIFELAISGTGPFDMSDFLTLSEQTLGGDNILTFAVVKFINANPDVFNKGHDSAFGASDSFIPEPSSFVLAVLGLCMLLGYRRRRRSA